MTIWPKINTKFSSSGWDREEPWIIDWAPLNIETESAVMWGDLVSDYNYPKVTSIIFLFQFLALARHNINQKGEICFGTIYNCVFDFNTTKNDRVEFGWNQVSKSSLEQKPD